MSAALKVTQGSSLNPAGIMRGQTLDDRCRRPALGSTQRNAFTRVPLFIVSRKDANVSNQNL
jgi:hypothetical protein